MSLFRKLISTECVFLYIITIIARPTLTSAAATTIIKKTNNWASVANAGNFAAAPLKCIFENATNKRFTEFNISSMHINTMMALRLVNAPMTPIQNNATAKNIYHLISISYNFTYRPIPIVFDAGFIEKISLIFFAAIPLNISTALYDAAFVRNFTMSPDPMVTRPDAIAVW